MGNLTVSTNKNEAKHPARATPNMEHETILDETTEGNKECPYPYLACPRCPYFSRDGMTCNLDYDRTYENPQPFPKPKTTPADVRSRW
jgi:hypothetical protein